MTTPPPAEGTGAQPPIRVVVADDHPAVRSGLVALLGSAPDIIVVAEAADGEAAVAAAREHRPDVVRGQLFCNLNNGKGYKKVVYRLITALLTNVLARPHFLARGQDSARNPSFLICKYLFRAPVFVWTVRAQSEIPADQRDGMIFEGFIPKE